MQNSWYMKGEGVHHFFCECGGHDTVDEIVEDEYEVLEFKREEIDFSAIPNIYYPDNSCSMCGNERYLDRDALLFNNLTHYWSGIVWEYGNEVNDKGWFVWAMLTIPAYDSLLKKFYFKNIRLLEIRLEHSGAEKISSEVNYFLKKEMKVEERYIQLEIYMKRKLVEQMVLCVEKEPTEEIAWLLPELKKVSTAIKKKEMLYFFIKNKHIRFVDIFFWKHKEFFIDKAESTLEATLDNVLNHRKEKSLRKAHYASYQEQMENGGYNPLLEYIFSHTIDDPNHLLKLLILPAEIKQKFFQKTSVENIYHFIYFLKVFYSERVVVQFWLNIANGWLDSFYLKDTINLFREERMREELQVMFRKAPLNITVMHDQLVQHYRVVKKSMISDTSFFYEDNFLSSEVECEGLVYSLPKNQRELYEWGEILGNCLFSYNHAIFAGETVVYAIFIDKRLRYALEIRNDKVMQLSATYNRPIESFHKVKVEKWFREIYLKNRIKVFD